jgi:hypothetical protein
MRNILKRYESFLRLYPEPYRNSYGKQMRQTFEDMLADASSDSERRAIYRRVALNLPVSIAHAQLSYLGGIMQTETPNYVKRTGLLTAALIVPFFLAVITNAFNEAVYGHDLDSSWLWSTPALFTWVLILPAMAVVLALVVYVRFTMVCNQSNLFKRIFNVRVTWPVVVPGVLAIGILFFLVFHDSAHCIIGNPVRIVHNPHQTWQCISSGFFGGK